MTDKFYEKTLATERKYTGKIISVDLLDIELPDGRKARREVIRHGNAVAIVARRPDGKSARPVIARSASIFTSPSFPMRHTHRIRIPTRTSIPS